MSRFRPHGARILCVTGFEGELPEAVRHWLDQVSVRTEFSSDIYDALATLATGTRPIVMIVSIDAVDWNEMAFFSQVAGLSPGTRVFVSAHKTNDNRVFAAIERGARLFEPSQAQADLESVFAEAQTAGPAGLLAGTLKPPQVSRAPINIPPETVETPPSGDPVKEEPAPQQSPIRLVTSSEIDEAEDVPVSVPWAPHPDRPKRTPPRPADVPEARACQNDIIPEIDRPLSPVELTDEEIEALLDRPDADLRRRREQGS